MSSLSQKQMHDISRLDSFFGDEEELPVFLLTPRWSPVILVDPTTEDLCFVSKEKDRWMLYVRAFIDEQLAAFSVPVQPNRYALSGDGSMAVFGSPPARPGDVARGSIREHSGPDPRICNSVRRARSRALGKSAKDGGLNGLHQDHRVPSGVRLFEAWLCHRLSLPDL